MADAKITELSELTSVATTDLVAIVDDPAGTPVTKKITVDNLTAGSIKNTLVAAKGDLITATANDTPAIQSVGSNGQVLIADSTATNGIEWADPMTSMARQAIINGNFDVWQRGTSLTIGAISVWYVADRWKHGQGTGSAYTVSRQDGTGVSGSQYCLRLHRTAGNTGTSEIWTSYSMETADSIKFRGKKLTLSFYIRKGANLSGTLNVKLQTGTGTDEFSPGYTGSADVATEDLSSITTSWVKHTITTTNIIADTVNEIGLAFVFTPSGTAGAADYFEITQVQLCAGDVALPFMPKSFEEELRACQRYYEKSYEYATAPGTATQAGSTIANYGSNVAGHQIIIPVRYQVRKRTVTGIAISIWDDAGNASKFTAIDYAGSPTNNVAYSGVIYSGETGFAVYLSNTTYGGGIFSWSVSSEL